MGDQTFNCWWTTYPCTHVRAGQTVEVITREAYDGMVKHLQEQIDEAYSALVSGENNYGKVQAAGLILSRGRKG